ncbi:STAS domain-containing protein [Balneatrix alpica]|uniref:STAS domain-containing protein n=1 Tax=Balneatrix alpica TaxID=75684 RepID=A0ABV5Z6I3_9GAMM|nr:STAS domain-containing protein [Balneatrix alpica]
MQSGKILVAKQEGTYVLKFCGDVRLTLCSALDQFLETMLTDPDFTTVLIDLTETDGIDSTSLGLLAKISVRMQQKHRLLPTILSVKDDITRILMSMGFDKVFLLIREANTETAGMHELPLSQCSEDEMRTTVLDAHKILMNLNDQNKLVFKDLVASLEGCAPEARKH